MSSCSCAAPWAGQPWFVLAVLVCSGHTPASPAWGPTEFCEGQTRSLKSLSVCPGICVHTTGTVGQTRQLQLSSESVLPSAPPAAVAVSQQKGEQENLLHNKTLPALTFYKALKKISIMTDAVNNSNKDINTFYLLSS